MEPQIRYARTSDGVSIAYATMGQGLPFVSLPVVPDSHLGLALKDPALRSYLDTVASSRLLVMYDCRGMGLSTREVSDFSVEAQMRDLESVLDSAKIERAVLHAVMMQAPIAIAYAVRQPERVSHLVLWNPVASLAEMAPIPGARGLLEKNWELYTDAIAAAVLGWADPNEVKAWGERVRASVSRDAWQAYLNALGRFDAGPMLGQVSVPTLALQRGPGRREATQRVAAGIPSAELAIFDGPDVIQARGNWREVEDVIAGFLDVELAPPMSAGASTAIILFADIADSTALTEHLGDTAFREKARELDDALRRAITSNGGTAIDGKLLGDGVLATFGAAREAIAAALACEHAASATQLGLHIGLHAGDVIRERAPDGRDNVYGGAVNIASRISALAAPGEVLVSRTVADLARTSAGVTFEDRGEHELKGIDGPVRVFAVRSEG